MNKDNVLALAAHMETVDEATYNQASTGAFFPPYMPTKRTPGCLICHCVQFFGERDGESIKVEENGSGFLQRMLDVTREQMYELVNASPYGYGITAKGEEEVIEPTTEEAARMLRYFAETGSVNWSKART